MMLRDVLSAPFEKKGQWLFLPGDSAVWGLDVEALVLDLNEVTPEEDTDDDADVPREAKERGLRAVISVRDLGGIVANARAQKANVSLEELYAAFIHYLKHDAFLTL